MTGVQTCALPIFALLSRHGVVPVSSTQDTTGPMGRSVKDVAMMLTVMAGSDPADPDSADADANKTDYTKGLTTDALKGKRLGVIRGFGGYSEATKPAFDKMLDVLKAQGAELVDLPADLLEAEQIGVGQECVVLVENLLGHAVAAAEVAAVRHRDAEVLDGPAELVAQRGRGHPRPPAAVGGVNGAAADDACTHSRVPST